ncbi:hypothetical protein AVR77_gp171 [Salmonella phage Shivani]|uniref:Uncharacterized protein n=2 Tax=Tequintavirus TaxID=187218 RepID=Q6QGN0_BPT5|nr:hypothetical protein T5.057 [Escherichia phage T5]YP_009194703.1 hypothetical protein AVR77_gp171 [Salmonella phage Shivani]AAS77104.1 hypothetical protein T5.057 [Escherichia phage T5]AJA73506.1 hypothetical protein CPT_Shivani59 [Salmonella phage Shivani]
MRPGKFKKASWSKEYKEYLLSLVKHNS